MVITKIRPAMYHRLRVFYENQGGDRRARYHWLENPFGSWHHLRKTPIDVCKGDQEVFSSNSVGWGWAVNEWMARLCADKTVQNRQLRPPGSLGYPMCPSVRPPDLSNGTKQFGWAAPVSELQPTSLCWAATIGSFQRS